MIPKILHQCWFGPAPIPQEHKEWMAGVRSAMPDFEYHLWTNNDLPDTRFVNECLRWKKYALLSDYARLAIIHDYGGFYLDTDVEIKKSFATLLDNKCILGFSQCISTKTPVSNTIIAAEPRHDFILDCLKKMTWELNHRIKPSYGVKIGNLVLFGRGLSLCGAQKISDITILDRDVLYNEYAIHHFAGSWHSKKDFASRISSLGYRSTRLCTLLKGLITRKKCYP